jgi:hypothetical protein
MAKKNNITSISEAPETHAQRVTRIRDMLWERIEHALATEKGTALALTMRLAKEMVADAPAPAAESVTLAFDIVGEAGEASA